jgi:hypothetical protein
MAAGFGARVVTRFVTDGRPFVESGTTALVVLVKNVFWNGPHPVKVNMPRRAQRERIFFISDLLRKASGSPTTTGSPW